MPLGTRQHFMIEPSDLERTKTFYCETLGPENGDRPPLDFPGHWLYSGCVATVHLMGTRTPREGIVVRGTEKKYEDSERLDHIALSATDADDLHKRLPGPRCGIPREQRAAQLPVLHARRHRCGIELSGFA